MWTVHRVGDDCPFKPLPPRLHSDNVRSPKKPVWICSQSEEMRSPPLQIGFGVKRGTPSSRQIGVVPGKSSRVRTSENQICVNHRREAGGIALHIGVIFLRQPVEGSADLTTTRTVLDPQELPGLPAKVCTGRIGLEPVLGLHVLSSLSRRSRPWEVGVSHFTKGRWNPSPVDRSLFGGSEKAPPPDKAQGEGRTAHRSSLGLRFHEGHAVVVGRKVDCARR